MSEMELRTGTAVLLYEGGTDEELMTKAVIHAGETPVEDEWDLEEQFWDLEKYELVDDKVYILENYKIHDPYGDISGKLNPDGSIDFMCFWYNGGGSFSEALGSAIKRATEEK